MRIPHILMAAVLCTGALLASCATRHAYYLTLQGLAEQGRYADASSLVESARKKAYGDKNELLYLLDKGFYLHLAGDYAESNEYFEQAKKIAEYHFTKSMTTEASTLLVSDNTRPYYGEDFERALVNVFCALNYLMLNSPSAALVEARQVDQYLTTLQTNYGDRMTYREDPFARYLMGMIFENQGMVNDAFISYRLALDAYAAGRESFGVAVPRELIGDALRTAGRLGFSDEIAAITRDYHGLPPPPAPPSEGEVVVLIYAGFAPEKQETIFEIAFGKAWSYVGAFKVPPGEEAKVEQAAGIARAILYDDQIRVAFPSFERVPSRVSRVNIFVDDRQADAELVADISAIARCSLQDRIARVRVRAIARAAVKYTLARQISQKINNDADNEALGWLTKKALTVAASATERADLRSWRSLPDRILLCRLPVYAGTHTVSLQVYDEDGSSRRETVRDVVVTPGKKTFTIVRAPW